MSLFISFEGGEGSGKTTQVEMLRQRLEDAGYSVLPVREPGTTPLGQSLRIWLKKDQDGKYSISPGVELFLFEAARREMVTLIVAPTLEQANEIIIADRYADSSLAYQGYGRGMDLEIVEAMNFLATDGLKPDLTFLLDCPPETGLERVDKLDSAQLRLPLESRTRIDRRHEGARFEAESLDFHERVRAGYRELAAKEPERWCVIDSAKPADEICELVWQRVQQWMEDKGEPRPDAATA